MFSGSNNNTQLYIELIVTKKTETIPSGTPIHLMVKIMHSLNIFDLFILYEHFQLIYVSVRISLRWLFLILN